MKMYAVFDLDEMRMMNLNFDGMYLWILKSSEKDNQNIVPPEVYHQKSSYLLLKGCLPPAAGG